MKALIASILILSTTVAYAGPRHVLVLRAEGNADATTRTNVDQQIAKLAKSLEGNVELGEITFADAAAAVGCSGSEAQCRDEVLGMMGVDELISTSVTAMPSGDVRILVHRIPKGSATKDAQTTITPRDTLDGKIAAEVGPMFGQKARPAPVQSAPTPPPIVTNTTTTPPPPAQTTTAPAAGAPVGAFGNAPGPATPAAPVQTAQYDPNTQPIGAPPPTTDEGRGGTRGTTGLIVGGGLVVLSVLFWAGASSVQGDINAAPTRTPADFKNLQDLEQKGDAYSGLGNLCFLGGLVVGGISGYLFWKDRKAHRASQARITPTLVDHGIGLAFTYGATP